MKESILQRVIRSGSFAVLAVMMVVASTALAQPVMRIAHADSAPEVTINAVAGNRLEGYGISREGVMISFETRRGNPTPQELRDADPSTPPYEIDVRFLDDTGFPFLTIYGGHGAIDPTWAEATASPTSVSDERTLSNYAAARAIVAAIKDSPVAKEAAATADMTLWAPERDILFNVAAPALEDLLVIRKSESEEPGSRNPVTRNRPRANINLLSTNIYKWQVEVHKQTIWWTVGQGEHSATISRSISSTGVTQQTIVTSNHGTAANLMSMSCSWTSTATMPKTLPAIGTVTDGSAYYCNTHYGFTTGTHVCNDDSYVQAQTIRYNAGPMSWVTCGDGTLRRYAPGCQ